ncbi:alpha-amylase family glycosyl hydrolase [Flavimaricola marinus]|uniref:Oligo-1,6-glucosidase n=1 Tax=Flavimaricola marinus TaxID=1819565 RepID=A0A238LDC3_9RHOB|nr:alpha-amylase family glycosyl hydrolase [Flavimaricola marinus]SMY07553.1 Oligo-1,6-glucosidase [Flavimaricola marinus]
MTKVNVETAKKSALVRDPDWWRGAVIYQIYPRSFQDSTGDGVGDLRGIAQRLPYIASLGVDAIWISPFFTSPMKDFGYDVSNYCDVDPMFGDLHDFDAVVEAAHALGVRVIIDLVLSHTSDVHPWFEQSRTSRDNPTADWYVWADPKPDGTPPNNWLSIFGGSAWQFDGTRMQYYLHNFLTSQPDLNFHNPEVVDAILDVERFWLERGVDGFRLDTINFYYADKELRDNPACPPEMRNDSIAPSVNPYNWQEHLYSKNQPENLGFLKKFREVLNEYGAVAVGEVGDAQRGLEIMAEYTSGGDKVQMCYSFEMLQPKLLAAGDLVAMQTKLNEEAPEAWPCWALSNHDTIRHVTRWHLSPPAIKTYATLLVCQRGSVCLYQGEELGLAEADVAFEDLQDPYGIQFWPEFKGRDGCRTPMVWEPSNSYGGFSEAKPWLPVAPEHLGRSVSVQEEDEHSVLHHYRAAIALRHDHPALARGTFEDLEQIGEVVHFVRRWEGKEVYCAFNLGELTVDIDAPEGHWTNIAEDLNGVAIREYAQLRLGPWEYCIALKQEG